MTDSALLRWTLAIALLNASLTSYLLFARPDLPAADTAQKIFAQGQEADRAKDYPGAIKKYEEVLADYEISPIAPRAAFALAQIYLRKTFEIEKAREALRKIVDEFPESEFTPRASENLSFIETYGDMGGEPLRRWLRASELNKEGATGEAIVLLGEISDRFVTSKIRPMALFQLGELREKSGDHNGSYRAWRDLIDAYPEDPKAELARSRLNRR